MPKFTVIVALLVAFTASAHANVAIVGSDQGPGIVDAVGNMWSFGDRDPDYPLDYFVLKNGSPVSAGGGLNWSMSRLLILDDGTGNNLYATDDNYGGGAYKWNGNTFVSIASLPTPGWDPTLGGKSTSFMLYQCGNACNADLSDPANASRQDDRTLMTYMKWYGDGTLRIDPADRVSRSVRQTAQDRLAKMLTPSSVNPYGQNAVQITGEFRQFNPRDMDNSNPNGRGWYIPTNGYINAGAFNLYPVNGRYVSLAWTLSDQLIANIANMIDDIVTARSTDGSNSSFRTILLHLQFTDNAGSSCLGDSNYQLVLDQNFAIMNQVRGIIKRRISGSGIQLLTDLDAEAASSTAVPTGLRGFDCSAVNGTWSGGVPASTQYMIDMWSRYQALSDIHDNETSIGFSSTGDLRAMLDGFLANGLPLPPILGYDVYSNPAGFVAYGNSIQAAYYNSSRAFQGFWIMETDYTDLRNAANRAWVSALPAALKRGG